MNIFENATLEDGTLVCEGCLVEYMNENKNLITEAKYQGRSVPLGKPMRGDVKKFKVFVKDPSTGNIKKVNFGDPNMKIKKNIPARRKSFRARHKCATAKDRTSARYWSCRMWENKNLQESKQQLNEVFDPITALVALLGALLGGFIGAALSFSRVYGKENGEQLGKQKEKLQKTIEQAIDASEQIKEKDSVKKEFRTLLSNYTKQIEEIGKEKDDNSRKEKSVAAFKQFKDSLNAFVKKYNLQNVEENVQEILQQMEAIAQNVMNKEKADKEFKEDLVSKATAPETVTQAITRAITRVSTDSTKARNAEIILRPIDRLPDNSKLGIVIDTTLKILGETPNVNDIPKALANNADVKKYTNGQFTLALAQQAVRDARILPNVEQRKERLLPAQTDTAKEQEKQVSTDKQQTTKVGQSAGSSGENSQTSYPWISNKDQFINTLTAILKVIDTENLIFKQITDVTNIAKQLAPAIQQKYPRINFQTKLGVLTSGQTENNDYKAGIENMLLFLNHLDKNVNESIKKLDENISRRMKELAGLIED